MILQKVANFIYKQCENSKDDKSFQFWYNIGMQLNDYAINKFNIYLS